MLLCRYLDILNNLWIGDSTFSFCMRPCKLYSYSSIRAFIITSEGSVIELNNFGFKDSSEIIHSKYSLDKQENWVQRKADCLITIPQWALAVSDWKQILTTKSNLLTAPRGRLPSREDCLTVRLFLPKYLVSYLEISFYEADIKTQMSIFPCSILHPISSPMTSSEQIPLTVSRI